MGTKRVLKSLRKPNLGEFDQFVDQSDERYDYRYRTQRDKAEVTMDKLHLGVKLGEQAYNETMYLTSATKAMELLVPIAERNRRAKILKLVTDAANQKWVPKDGLLDKRWSKDFLPSKVLREKLPELQTLLGFWKTKLFLHLLNRNVKRYRAILSHEILTERIT